MITLQLLFWSFSIFLIVRLTVYVSASECISFFTGYGFHWVFQNFCLCWGKNKFCDLRKPAGLENFQQEPQMCLDKCFILTGTECSLHSTRKSPFCKECVRVVLLLSFFCWNRPSLACLLCAQDGSCLPELHKDNRSGSVSANPLKLYIQIFQSSQSRISFY